MPRFARTFAQPFQRNTEPFRGMFPLLKYSHFDRRVLSDYGMQLAIVDNRGVSRQDRRFHRGAIAVREDPIQRDLNDVPEIQLNFVVPQGIEEAIERFLQFGFEVSYDAD